MKHRLPTLYILIFAFLLPTLTQAQIPFERRVVDVSNLGIAFTNYGTIGTPNVRNNPSGPESMQYPSGSGTEHLFEAGIWIGAIYDGATTVSSSAITDGAGYALGKAGFEFTADAGFLEISSLPNSPFFSPQAISHQDLITEFTDRNTIIGNTPISAHEQPIYADVRMTSYNWNFGFSEALTIVKYDITNNSHIHIGDGNPESGVTWEQVYFGVYSDLVVRNINTTLETGGAFFNKGGTQYIDSLAALYVFDAGSNDLPRTNTYGATVILGSEYRGVEFHPRYADQVEAVGLDVPRVGPSYWSFSAGLGDFVRPNDDLQRYQRLEEVFPYQQNALTLRDGGRNEDGNFIQLNKIGPYPTVEPGETVTIYIAFVASLMPEQNRNQLPIQFNPTIDTDFNRQPLIENIDWAYRIFEGQVDEDGQRTRFLVPEPPAVPQLRVELEAGRAVLYWDQESEFSVDPISGEMDFEGYRVYRSQLGADLAGGITASVPQLIREWDIPGNDVGFNTGFDEVRLVEPITFPDDDTEYWYRFEVDGLLSGWQYEFSVTAFDRGDDGVESLESSRTANAVRVFPGTPVNEDFESGDLKVGVYPNPYRVNAAWDGGTPFTRKLNFYNLPARAEIRIYTLAGETVANLSHDASTYIGSTRWFNDFSDNNRIQSGGEHSWDLLSEANQNLATGLYLFSVKDLDSGAIQTGKFAVIK